jgi:hypothetical protein
MQSIDMVVDAAQEFLHQTAAFLPRLLLALLVVVAGWLFAKVVRFTVQRALRAINFNVLTERAGTDNFLRQAGMRGDTTTLFGLVAFWLVMLAALIIAFNGLGLNYISDLLGRAVLFAPKLLVAMLLIVFGSYCARFVGNAVHAYCVDARISDAAILSRLVRYVIMTLVVMIALVQVEIAGNMLERTLLIILAGIMLALALAFGLGGKDWAATLLQRWWPHDRRDEDV